MATKPRGDRFPDIAVPPGEYLAEEIEARGMTQTKLSKKMRRPLKAINEIINGKKAITAATALQLEKALPGTSAQFWMNLESRYQLTKAYLRMQKKPSRKATA
ncbi:MAG: addiction module antidote protein, HigA family [Dehalococcoidia bacterium]|nr:addiction module antidote protein, HigA family [Dehalococcoidia bacterium]